MKLRRWTRMSVGVLLMAIVGLACLGCGDPANEFIDQPGDFTKMSAGEEATAGEFCMIGEVTRPGVYSLSGQPMTITMALAAAGGMTGESTDESALIRRYGGDEEEIVPIDIPRILRGEQPDMILRPSDVIVVGRTAFSFHPVIPNAFRMRYEPEEHSSRFDEW